MIYLIAFNLLITISGIIFLALVIHFIGKEVQEIKRCVENLDIPVPTFKCNVPPIDDKDKPFVQTAPTWDETPAPPE